MSMATVAARLPETLQTLVDSRLDTIDRMLLGRLPRQDRVAIVNEVESQIFDLLGGRNGRDLGRDDVLAVLARLDPPEAYLPEEGGMSAASPRAPAMPRAAVVPAKATSPLAKAGGILGLVCLTMIAVSAAILVVFQATQWPTLGGIAEISMLVSLVTVPMMGLIAIVLASISRLSGGWGVFGLVSGIVSLLGGAAAVCLMFF